MVYRDGVEHACFAAKRADSILERMRGLLGRKPLMTGEGLWIAPCNSIHSCFMGYPIDVIYLDRQQRVCKLVPMLVPWRCSFSLCSESVFECIAGEIDRMQIKLGDLFQWCE